MRNFSAARAFLTGLGLMFGLVPAHAGSVWKGTLQCSYGSGSLNIKIDDLGNVSGGMTNGTIRSGRLSGTSITFTYSNMFGNGGVFAGSVFGNTMGGSYSQRAGTAETCKWEASLVGSASPAKPKQNPRDDTRNREIAEAKGLIERAKIVQRQPGCESQRQAAGLLADASVIYRRLGMAGNSDKINAAADKLTGEGGTYYKCLAKRSAKRTPQNGAKPSPAKPEQATGKKPPSIRDCLRAKLQLELLRKQANDDPANDAIFRQARDKIRREGCKV